MKEICMILTNRVMLSDPAQRTSPQMRWPVLGVYRAIICPREAEDAGLEATSQRPARYNVIMSDFGSG